MRLRLRSFLLTSALTFAPAIASATTISGLYVDGGAVVITRCKTNTSTRIIQPMGAPHLNSPSTTAQAIQASVLSAGVLAMDCASKPKGSITSHTIIIQATPKKITTLKQVLPPSSSKTEPALNNMNYPVLYKDLLQPFFILGHALKVLLPFILLLLLMEKADLYGATTQT